MPEYQMADPSAKAIDAAQTGHNRSSIKSNAARNIIAFPGPHRVCGSKIISITTPELWSAEV